MKMFSSAAQALLLASAAFVQAQYTVQEEYLPSGWFDKFDFFTAVDPTHGFAQYVNESYARQQSFIDTSATDHVYIGVDHTNSFSTGGTCGIDTGRPSVRLQSQNTYTHGLFVLSLNHMPYGCGAWPAFWTLGANGVWPSTGEIDIIENVNLEANNLMSLHTGDGCTIAGSGETGTLTANDCFSDGGSHSGCTVKSGSDTSFGSNFDNADGGIYAMEWTSDYIRIWNWELGSEPSDVAAATSQSTLDPSGWGTPVANFQGSCDIDDHFSEHQIVFDITFCGDFAGAMYGSSGCVQTSGLDSSASCAAFVAQNPSAFQDTYWDINYLRVYQQSPTTSTASSPTSTPLSSVSPVAITRSTTINLALGASTTETKGDSATVVVPPQTMSSVGPTVVSTAAAYTYTACVVNDIIPTNAVQYDSTISSVEDCAQWCYSDLSGGPFLGFALENGSDCYCFNEPGTSYPVTASDCTIPCVSSTVEACGGTTAVDLYVISGYSYGATSGTGSMLSTPTSKPSGYSNPTITPTSTPVTPTPDTSSPAITSSTPLPTVSFPDAPEDDAYYINTYGDTARIYASASVTGGATITVEGASQVSASSFPKCVEACDDLTFNDNGFVYGDDFLWCIAAIYNEDVDAGVSCTLIANPDCVTADGLDQCTNIEDSPYYVADAGSAQRRRRDIVERQVDNGLGLVSAADSSVAYFILEDGDSTPVAPVTSSSASSSSSSTATSSSDTATSDAGGSSTGTSTGTSTTTTSDTSSSSSSASSSATSGDLGTGTGVPEGVLPPTSGLSVTTTPTPDPNVVISVIYVTTCSPAPTLPGGAALFDNSTSNSTTFLRA